MTPDWMKKENPNQSDSSYIQRIKE